MDAIVIAGGVPQPDDALYPFTQGKAKAILDVGGRPMIQWILDALGGASHVGRVVVIGLDSDAGLECSKPTTFLPNQGEMLDNIRTGTRQVMALNSTAEVVLSVSADIPALRSEMVDWIVEAALETEHDVYYSVIRRDVMESRFPGSNRSYVRLKDGEFCGGDVNVFRTAMVNTRMDIWERIIAARKNALKQAALIGFDTLFLLLLHRLTIQGTVQRASKRLGMRGRALVSPYAEIGMDVDKPYQLELLRADLSPQAIA